MRANKLLTTTLGAFALLLTGACGKHSAAARTQAIEVALKRFEEIEIPTGPKVNIARDGLPAFRRLESSGLISIKDVPQGYWDNFATRTFMGGAQAFRVVATAKLNSLALNPRWSAPTSSSAPLSSEAVAKWLDIRWKSTGQYLVSLGPNLFSPDADYGDRFDGFAIHYAPAYEDYSILAANGLITLSEISIADIPRSARPPDMPNLRIRRAVKVTLTPAGGKLAQIDTAESQRIYRGNVATFVFGIYKIAKISNNALLPSRDGVYRLVEGTYIFDPTVGMANTLISHFKLPEDREGRFRAVFHYCENGLGGKALTAPQWVLAGHADAVDFGSKSGEFQTAIVPPLVDELPLKGTRTAFDDGTPTDEAYTWRLRPGDLKIGEILRDEEYKGALATPGETFHIILATLRCVPVTQGAAVPTELASLLPGRLRCILKYSDFDKEWKVVAVDVAPTGSDQWASENVK
jgi:hypothetical protein